MSAGIRLLCAIGLAVAVCPAQQKKAEPEAAEQKSLEQAVSEAGGSPVDFIRALESHLAKYPKTGRRSEIERAIAKAALETKDNKRIIQYGEKVLASEPDDMVLLERVSRALLSSDEKETAARALKYAKHLESLVRAYDKQANGSKNAGRMREDIDRTLAKALVLQARATGNTGQAPEAVNLARQSYEAYPTAEAAREIGKWLVKAGKQQEAIPHYADALIISDPRTTDAERAIVREKLSELQRKIKGSEAGLGDEVLAAYDRTTALLRERQLRMKQFDPNAQAASAGEFTLTGLDGGKLALSSLRGKVVVMDFWATWCGPCRVQQPLYHQVKQRFRENPNVVFLSVNTDEEHEGVAEFLEQHKWDKTVYFEDGLSAKLQVSSIPTTILLDREGQVASRMNGFIPDRFVDMLSERIDQVLRQ